MRIVPMTDAYAADIVGWRHNAPYDCYDMTAADRAFMVSPASGYFALVDDGSLIGFRSFGADGQVPGGVYDSLALDTGGGLRPELTGHGLGRQAIATGLDITTPRIGVAIDGQVALPRAAEQRGQACADCFRGDQDGQARCRAVLMQPAGYLTIWMTRSMPSWVCSRPSWVSMKHARTQYPARWRTTSCM